MSPTLQKQERSLEKWRAIISAYQQSSMSKAAFCKAHKLSRSNFYMWAQYFRNAEKAQDPSPPSAFVPISLIETETTIAKSAAIAPEDRIKSALQLTTNKGLRLSFANGCSYGELQKVMELLQNAA